MSAPPIAVRGVSHWFGEDALRTQVLFDITAEIQAGEIVILTGPSGSGKTTLLTLIGALRSAQAGSLRVFGRELRDADEHTLAEVRRRIGYVFQAHNLLEALTAEQNVEMSLQLDPSLSEPERKRRARETLEAVGLGARSAAHPSELSGGQRQRVAIARALARRPEILLADEPTASLDRRTGREVVEILETLARDRGVTVVLVTHDSRILDVADRILSLEDGRLSSLMDAVTTSTRRMLGVLAQEIRRGDLAGRLDRLDPEGFAELLAELTDETRRLLDVVDLIQGETFESVLEQVVGAFTTKVAGILSAERATLHFVDPEDGELWSLGTCEHGQVHGVRAPGPPARAEETARSGRNPTQAGVLSEPAAGAQAGGSRLCVPVVDSQGRTFAVVELHGKRGGGPFDADDERQLRELTDSLGLLLEGWWRMSCTCRTGGVGRTPACCAGAAGPASPSPAAPDEA